MSKLFEQLAEIKLIEEWAAMLDWYFDENKFDKSKWGKVPLTRLTKMIKNNITKLDYVEYSSIRNISIDKNNVRQSGGSSATIIFSKSDGCFCKDLIRHIRNGIAHGKTDCIKQGDIIFISIGDYNTKKQQTAYIYMPLDYLLKLFECYNTCKAA